MTCIEATFQGSAGPCGEASPRENLLSFSPDQLEHRFRALQLPAYRARQVGRWIFRKYVSDFSRMTDLPADLRGRLRDAFQVRLPRVASASPSKDRMTWKLLLVLEDGQGVEGVLMFHPKRRPTLCISTQVGCAQGCLFCASGKMGLRRDLSAAEILGQVWLLRRLLHVQLDDRRTPTLVFMGMGEPFDNEENFIKAVQVLNDPAGFGLGSRRMTISSVGEPDKIRRLARLGLSVNLALSLHAPDDALRGKLMPRQKGTPVRDVIEAARTFREATGRDVTFEYVLIRGVNDGLDQARQLAALLKGFPGKVNLIPHNPVTFNKMRPPSKPCLSAFQRHLEGGGLKVTVRHSQGGDIDAACGQLALREMIPTTEVNHVQ